MKSRKNEKLLICIFIVLNTNAQAEKRHIDVEKIVREKSVVVKTLNNMGFNVFNSEKTNREKKEKRKNKVWVEGKSLRECMGGEKTINNNVIMCQSGHFKEE